MTFDPQGFMSRLPHLKGRIRAHAPLARLSWFRTGGVADLLFEPADEADLLHFLKHLPHSVPLSVLGVGSNLLIRDGGVEGVVLRLGRGFADIRIRADKVSVGAGAMDVHVARAAADAGLGGLEFLVGVPGTIGGAVRMNAGAYGNDIASVFVQAHGVDRAGHALEFSPDNLDFGYRSSRLPSSAILTRVCLRADADDPQDVRRRMQEISTERTQSQPIGTRTGGSTFKNPPADVSPKKAWQLVDEAGCRGLRVGDAQVSEKHTNFLINRGAATAADIERLGEEVRRRVHETSGVRLEWEIKRLGRFNEGEAVTPFGLEGELT